MPCKDGNKKTYIPSMLRIFGTLEVVALELIDFSKKKYLRDYLRVDFLPSLKFHSSRITSLSLGL